MDKAKTLAKQCVLFSMEAVKNSIISLCEIGNGEKIEQLSVVMKNLAEAYKNIK